MDWIYEYYRVIAFWIAIGFGILLLFIPKWLGMDHDSETKKGAGIIRFFGIVIIFLLLYSLLMNYLRESP